TWIYDQPTVEISMAEDIIRLGKPIATEYMLEWFQERFGPEKGRPEFFRLAIKHTMNSPINKFQRQTRPPDDYRYEDGKTVLEILQKMKNRELRDGLLKLK